LLHPSSLEEVRGDHSVDRRELLLSKARAYPVLEDPPKVDSDFATRSGGIRSSHDHVDVELLRAVEANAVSFLLTEDQGLVRRAGRIGLSDRVLSVGSGLQYFVAFFERIYPVAAPYVRKARVHSLDSKDPFFDSFRSDYPAFDEWLRKAATQGRLCYKSDLPDGKLGSVLILKESDLDPVCGRPPVPRLKICSLKVSEEQSGFRLGETLINLALEFASRNRMGECFVTVFPKYGELISLLTTFGFQSSCSLPNGEEVLIKNLVPPPFDGPIEPVDYLRLFFPRFIHDSTVRKFVVPIRPEYHRLIFPEYGLRGIQRTLDGTVNMPPPAGNAIRKAYLCNAKTTRIRPGDVVLFYRSGDRQGITHRGVVEEVRKCATPEEVVDFVGNRTVLPRSKLEQMCYKPVLSILFWNVGKVEPEVGLSDLTSRPVSM
jgi:hypothetical protein